MRRAIEIGEKTIGNDHPDQATRFNNLALLLKVRWLNNATALLSLLTPNSPVLQAQGKLDEAEEPTRRALAVWEKALGPDHPQVAKGLNNLAQLLQVHGLSSAL